MLKVKPAGKLLLLIAVGAGLYAIWRYVLPEQYRRLGFDLRQIPGLGRVAGPPSGWATTTKGNPIRVAVPPSAAVVGLLAANGGADTAQGSIYDTDCALAVRLDIAESASARVELLATKKAQFYVTELSGFVQDVPALRARGLEPVVVLLCAWSNGADVVVADPGVKGIADLAGHKVAVVRRSAGYFFLRSLLDADQNAKELWPRIRGEIRLYDDYRTAANAYAKKEVDAVALQDPYVAYVMQLRKSHELATTRDHPRIIAQVLVADRTWVEQNTDVCALLIRGWLRGVEGLGSDVGRPIRLLGETFALSADESKPALQHTTIAGVDDNTRFFGQSGSTPAAEMTPLAAEIERILREDLEPGTSEAPARLMEVDPLMSAIRELGR